MFNCLIHGWNHIEKPCTFCEPARTFATSGTTIPFSHPCKDTCSGYKQGGEEMNRELTEKLAVAVEALKYYAHPMSYTLDDYRGVSGEMLSRVVLYGDSTEINEVSSHAGRRAREALKKIEGIKR